MNERGGEGRGEKTENTSKWSDGKDVVTQRVHEDED
jgi:hypothetical protein